MICLRLGAQPTPQPAPTNVLQTAAEIRQLTPAQAAMHYPVQLRGVLTFFDKSQFFQFIHDDTAGIYFYMSIPPWQPLIRI